MLYSSSILDVVFVLFVCFTVHVLFCFLIAAITVGKMYIYVLIYVLLTDKKLAG